MSKHIDSYRNYAYEDDLGVYGKWIGKAIVGRINRHLVYHKYTKWAIY